jgi:membrane dipeptidase
LDTILSQEQMTDYKAVHKQALVADLHCDTALLMKRGYDIAERHETNHVDIPRLREGGVNLQIFACFLDSDIPPEKHVSATDELIDTVIEGIESHSDDLAQCRTADEARLITDSGKIAILVAIENGMALGNDLDNLARFHERGARYLTLIHNVSSDWCVSANDTIPSFEGLTDFGCDVVQEMNRVGMIVDISHVHPLGVTKVLEVTKQPVIASHSCAFSLCAHPRNLTDPQIRAIADNGGMIGMNFHGDFVSDRRWAISKSLAERQPDIVEELKGLLFGKYSGMEYEVRHNRLAPTIAEWTEAISIVNATIEDVVDHIDYFVNLVGVEYVGLGSDFDGIWLPPAGLEDCSKFPSLTEELCKRNYSSSDIEKILGENFMRVFKEVCG